VTIHQFVWEIDHHDSHLDGHLDCDDQCYVFPKNGVMVRKNKKLGNYMVRIMQCLVAKFCLMPALAWTQPYGVWRYQIPGDPFVRLLAVDLWHMGHISTGAPGNLERLTNL